MNEESKEFLEQLAGMAQHDQQDAARRQCAVWLYQHFDYLTKAGFNERQAMWMTAVLQNLIYVGPRVQQG